MPADLDPTATGPMLRSVVAAALEAEGHLLTAGELLVLRRYLALPVQASHLYARLLHRVRDIVRLDVLSAAERSSAELLLRKQLLDRLVPWPRRWELLRVPELRQACRALGLDARGRRAQLGARLVAQENYCAQPMARVRHRSLFRRLQQIFLRSPRADYRVLILDALGLRRSPTYDCQPGLSALPDRRALRQYRQARALLDACMEGEDPVPHLERALAWLARAPEPNLAQRRFSPRRVAARLAALAARQLERQRQPERALQVYRTLLEDGTLEPGPLLQRMVLALEAAGRPAEATQLAATGRSDADPVSALALERSGRRLAKRADMPWEALPSPTEPPQRQFELRSAPRRGPRPLYHPPGDDQAALPVEAALVALLAARGRRVLHGESAPWRTIFALVLRDLYFLPVPGMLPVPHLAGPLDLGSAAFAANRQQPLERRLEELSQGAGPELIQRRYARHAGEALAGARWDLADGATLAEIARAVGGAGLAQLMRRLAFEGWSAQRGLPDLLVLPGPEVSLPSCSPPDLGPSLLLAEVKGPGDQVRDAQAAWFRTLQRAQVPLELWRVRRLALE